MKAKVVHMLQLFDRWTGRIDSIVRGVVAVLMFVMFALLLMNVLSRYVILQPFFWLAEGAGYMMAMVGLFGSSSCLRGAAHMQVTLIPKRLAGPDGMNHRYTVAAIKIAVSVLVILYAWVMIKYGYLFAEFGRNEYSPSGYFIVFWPRLSVPIGGVLIAVQSLNLIGRTVNQLLNSVGEEIDEN